MNYYAAYVNLDSRPDRNEHMQKELARVGLSAVRQRGIPWKELDYNADKYKTMMARTPGAAGCYESQLTILGIALSKGQSAMVLEDDLIIASDIKERLLYIESYLEGKEWDCVFLGGTVHIDKPYWHGNPHEKHLSGCRCGLNSDYALTDDKRIIRCFGAFSTHAYVINFNSLEKIIDELERLMPTSIGVDFSLIQMQPKIKAYMFLPGCVKQMDNLSDIGTGMTYFSRFNKLGSHWFADKMEDYVEIKHRIELVALLKTWKVTGAIVECGVAEGLFSKDLLDAGAEFLYCVDNWGTIPNTKGDGNFPQEWHDANYNAALDRVKDYKNVSLLRMMSLEASRQFLDNSLAMVYHDADHSYKGVREDIVGWYPKIKPGGIMAWHDYFQNEYGVRKAVEEMFPDAQYNFILEADMKDSGCFIRKPF